MPLDPNIILQGQMPQFQSPLDTMTKVMTLKSLAARNQLEGAQAQTAMRGLNDQNSLRQATANNTTVDPNTGRVVQDRQGTLAELAKTNPTLALKQQQDFSALDLQNLKNHYETLQEKHNLAAQYLGEANDQKSWDNALSKIQGMNGDVSQIPTQYDPKIKHVAILSTLNGKEQIEAEARDRGLDIQELGEKNKAKQLGMEMFKTYGAAGPGMMGGGGSGARGSGSAKNQAAPQDVDPSAIVPRVIPPDRQAKALEEIKDNQNIAKIAQPSLAAFDQAAMEVRPLSGGLKTSLTAFIPGSRSAGQKAFAGLANTTVKDVEGTARQAAFDSLEHNFMPQFGDSDDTIKQKRANWINYLTSHAAAPTNKAFGIDLSRYSSTSIDPKTLAQESKSDTSVAKNLPKDGDTKDYNGETYKVVSGHWVKQPKQASK